MKIFKAIKSYFLSRSIREKMLVLGLVAVLAAVWVSGVFGRGAARLRDLRSSGVELEEQRGWLNERERIEQRNKAAIANLEPSRTFDLLKLQAKMLDISRTVRLNPHIRIVESKPTPTNLFTYNTVTLQLNNVPSSDWNALRAFEAEIHKLAPYIGVESSQIRVNPANEQLSLTMRVFSVELVR